MSKLLNHRAGTLLLAAMLAGLAACEHKGEAPADDNAKVSGDTISFSAASPALKNIQLAKVDVQHERQLSLPGRLVWDEDRTVRVFTPFAGRVSRVIANVGERVARGQVLAELQSPDFAVAQADARKTQATLRVTKAALARVRELAANGIAAGKDLLQAEADYANAEAEANRAAARIRLYGTVRGMQDGEQPGVDQKFALVAPIAGTVVERNLNPGQELRPDQPGAPQFVVTDPTRLWVQLDAAEGDLGALKPGTLMLVTTTQYPDDTFAGELKQIADYIDPVSRTLKLRGSVANADRRLKAEMFVNARVAMPRSDYLVVPERAVFLDGIRRFVFVKIGARQFMRRGVKVGAESAGMVAVLGGLKEGELVATSGNLYLQQMIVSARGAEDALELPPVKPAANNQAGTPADARAEPRAEPKANKQANSGAGNGKP